MGKVTRFPEGKMLLSHTTVADGGGPPLELTCVGKVTRFPEGKMMLSLTTVADGGRAFPRN